MQLKDHYFTMKMNSFRYWQGKELLHLIKQKGTYIDILLGLAMNGSDNKSRIERYYWSHI